MGLQLLLYRLINTAAELLYLVLIIRIILSWVPHNPSNRIIQFIYQLSEPILRPFQSIVPSYKIGIDLSPLFAFIAIGFVKTLLLRLLVG